MRSSAALSARWLCALLTLPLLSGCGVAAHRVAVAAEVLQYESQHPGNYGVYYIPAESMRPTLGVGDEVLVDTGAYRHASPHRGDIVTFKPPLPSPNDFIKRIVATPGDTLRISRGTLYVNGRPVREPYVRERPDYDLQVRDYGIYTADSGQRSYALSGGLAAVPPRAQWASPDRLPSDCYFVLGDNRNDSEDSHMFGCVARGNIHGKLVKVL